MKGEDVVYEEEQWFELQTTQHIAEDACATELRPYT